MADVLSRQLSQTLARLVGMFPVVAITGPRQSGKTTLARRLFPTKPYVSLEDPVERAFAEEDPRGFLARYHDGAIFDEAQRWPDLFSHLQGLVDADRRPGRFVLTGSQQFGLLAAITQSLAGRVGLTTLLPFSNAELAALPHGMPGLDDVLLKGGYPAIHAHGIPPADWFPSYVATYLERDVRQITGVRDMSIFQRFVRLCAGRCGQLLNLTALADEAGISHNTARAWVSILEASYIVFLLQPYYRNFGKRLVKTPKLYFHDVGLATWLLGIRDRQAVDLHPMRGALFESLVVGEFLKARYNAGVPPELYFWRDNNGLEADLVFETGDTLQTIEIKSGSTPTTDLVRAGLKSARFAGETANEPWLIYGGDESFRRSGVRVISWRQAGTSMPPEGDTQGN